MAYHSSRIFQGLLCDKPGAMLHLTQLSRSPEHGGREAGKGRKTVKQRRYQVKEPM